VSGLEVDKVDKKQTYTKTEVCKQYFEYFCRMSSKSILIILSYTVSKFVRLLLIPIGIVCIPVGA